MRIVICDDDKFYVNEIERNINNILVEKNIPFVFDLYIDSENLFNSNMSYDLALLDIEMQPYNGIQIAEKLKEINPYIIIFIITSYDKYLDDAMDLNVFRYIKKPLDSYRLKTGFLKALESIDNNVIKFNLKKDNKTKIIASNDIVYIETVSNATKVCTTSGDYLSNDKIDVWNKKLVASFFFRVHKSFIINIKYLSDYTRDIVTLSEKYKIPISYRKQAEFRSYFLRFFGGR